MIYGVLLRNCGVDHPILSQHPLFTWSLFFVLITAVHFWKPKYVHVRSVIFLYSQTISSVVPQTLKLSLPASSPEGASTTMNTLDLDHTLLFFIVLDSGKFPWGTETAGPALQDLGTTGLARVRCLGISCLLPLGHVTRPSKSLNTCFFPLLPPICHCLPLHATALGPISTIISAVPHLYL